MKNYDEMPDSEINWRVHLLWNNVKEGHATICCQDFCNDPSDACPIIVKHGISLNYWDGYWCADIQHEGEVGYEYEDKNPLRAAMICYLMMKDDE